MVAYDHCVERAHLHRLPHQHRPGSLWLLLLFGLFSSSSSSSSSLLSSSSLSSFDLRPRLRRHSCLRSVVGVDDVCVCFDSRDDGGHAFGKVDGHLLTFSSCRLSHLSSSCPSCRAFSFDLEIVVTRPNHPSARRCCPLDSLVFFFPVHCCDCCSCPAPDCLSQAHWILRHPDRCFRCHQYLVYHRFPVLSKCPCSFSVFDSDLCVEHRFLKHANNIETIISVTFEHEQDLLTDREKTESHCQNQEEKRWRREESHA